nr:collagen alpha-1(I) chain-like [Aegilops tauschii subsp. strangulata]
MAIGSSGTGLPVPVRTSSGPVAERTRGTAREHPHHPGSPGLVSGVVRTPDDEPRAASSRDGVGPPAGGTGPSRGVVVPPYGGAATSKTPTPAPTARSSQVVRDEQRRPAGDPGRRPRKSPMRPSHDEEGQHAHRGTGGGSGWPQGRDGAPSNAVRGQSTSRSTQLLPPPTPAEALAHAQLLLDFPPAAEKLDEWRATVRSLVGIANNDELRPAGPIGRRSVEPPHASGGRAGGDAAMGHSPPPYRPPRVSLTQPSIEPSTGQNKRRKLGPGKYFPTELPGAAGEDVAMDADPAAGQPTPAGPEAMAVETAAPIVEEMPSVLAVEPQALAWA